MPTRVESGIGRPATVTADRRDADSSSVRHGGGSADDTPAPTGPRPPWIYSVPAGVLGAVVVALLVLVVVLARPGHRSPARASAAGSSPPATSGSPTPAAAPATTAPATPSPQRVVTVPADQLAAEQADLRRTAALLTSRVRLASPAAWDQWLPAGKPYPGASTADDISTCPRLADRLGAAFGTRMSYWTGTLPDGPVGCTWATVPLSYDGPYHYAYLVSVGYLADGSTTESWRHHFYEHQGATCPDVDVPAVGPGAILVRCEDGDPDFTLVLPDARRPGVWFLEAAARTDAAHPASFALTTLVGAVAPAYP